MYNSKVDSRCVLVSARSRFDARRGGSGMRCLGARVGIADMMSWVWAEVLRECWGSGYVMLGEFNSGYVMNFNSGYVMCEVVMCV